MFKILTTSIMAGTRIEIMNLRNLISLKSKGLSNRKVALTLGINRNTVNEYVKFYTEQNFEFKELLEWPDKEIDDLFSATSEVDDLRFKELSLYFDYFSRELKKVGCTRDYLWREYKQKHPDGYMYSQFNHHLSVWINRLNGSTKLTHKLGEKLYIDFAGKKLSYVDKTTGEIVNVEVLVCILPASQYTFAMALRSQKVEDLVKGLNECLTFLGGVPLAIVPDNLKSAVIKSHKFAPKINPTLRDLANHYGCVISPTRVYSPKDKALVEGAVKLAYERIYYPMSKQTFFSIDELNQELSKHLLAHNRKLLSQSSTTREQEFLATEKVTLGQLPATSYNLRYFKKLTVQKMGHVYLSQDKHYYSVPYRLIGKLVTLSYNSDTIEVYSEKERVAFHKRSFAKGKYSTDEKHLSSAAKAYSEWSLSHFENKASKIGFFTKLYVTLLIKQYDYPEIGYKQAQGILSLTKQYPSERIENACQRASEIGKYNYTIIENILKNNMDMEQSSDLTIAPIINNPNVRGNYY
jgi:transposase